MKALDLSNQKYGKNHPEAAIVGEAKIEGKYRFKKNIIPNAFQKVF